ncbi:hypothetical protein C8J56DRAFT_1166352, partial [Mycena floridula]
MSTSIILCPKCGHDLSHSSLSVSRPNSVSRRNLDDIVSPVLADDVTAELQKYDLEIQRLEGALQILRDQREQALLKGIHCRYEISAIRRLPTETWTEIFAFACLGELEFTSQNPAASIYQVCKQWRDIVTSFPAFWASFVLDVREGQLTKDGLIIMHGRQSKSLPLTIQVSNFGRHLSRLCLQERLLHPRGPSLFTHILHHQGPQAVEGPLTEEHVPISQWLQALFVDDSAGTWGFENLESLELGPGERHENIDITMFSRSSKLCRLILYGYGGDILPAVHWTQLSDVYLCGVTSFVVHHLLAHCSSISKAEVRPLYDSDVTFSLPFPPCITPSLISLEIYLEAPCSQLIRSLDMPVLTSLEFQSTVDAEDLLALCERSSFPLLSLSLSYTSMVSNFPVWESIFLSLPKLTTLTFCGSCITPEFLERLADSENPLLPKLKVLQVSCSEDADILEPLLNIVEARFYDQEPSDIARLKEVFIHVMEPLNIDPDDEAPSPARLLPFNTSIVAQVAKLKGDGLDIALSRDWDYYD